MSHHKRRKRLESVTFTAVLMTAWAVAVISAVATVIHHP
ncbi:hypothetical protein OK074_6779 [Actinobacteria bacterium OK074]|nr:hypothetical protein OK074_6779 [Actinobacteria bacterium OK074]